MDYHRDHQLAKPGCIAATAETLWRHVDAQRLTTALERMPVGAREYWHVNEI